MVWAQLMGTRGRRAGFGVLSAPQEGFILLLNSVQARLSCNLTTGHVPKPNAV